MNTDTLTRITIPVSLEEKETLRRVAHTQLRDPRDHARYLLRQALGLTSVDNQNDNRPAEDRQALTGAIVTTN